MGDQSTGADGSGPAPRCPECGAEVQATWDWCHACGYDPDGLRPVAPTPPPLASYPPPAPPPAVEKGAAPTSGTYLPSPPPTRRPSGGRVTVLVTAGIALLVLVVLAAAAITLVGRRSSNAADAPSAPVRSPGTSTTRALTGPCGPIPTIVPMPGAADPGLMVRSSYVDGIDVARLDAFYGKLIPTTAFSMPTIDDYMARTTVPDPDGRRAELEADGYLGGADRGWTTNFGDTVVVRIIALSDTEHARSFAQHHLAAVCADQAWDMAPTPNLAGAASFLHIGTDGRPEVRTVAVVGNAEVNVTICTCRPAATGMAAAGSWIGGLQHDLVVPTA